MTFFTVVLRGLWRRPLRTGLTLAGISIGIAAVVALVGMSRGFEKGWQVGLKARGTDIVVSNKSGSLTPKPFDASVRDRIANLPRIAATCNLLVQVTSVEDSDLMILSGSRVGRICLEQSRTCLRTHAARCHGRGGGFGSDGGGDTQEKSWRSDSDRNQRTQGRRNRKGWRARRRWIGHSFACRFCKESSARPTRSTPSMFARRPGRPSNNSRNSLDKSSSLSRKCGLVTVSEHLSHAEGFRLIKAMSWGTSLLAILVGVLGVMNTMLMTVFERTHEICVLLAVGWTRGRIMRMILYESALLGLFGGVVGVAIGAIGVKVLSADAGHSRTAAARSQHCHCSDFPSSSRLRLELSAVFILPGAVHD